jgi:hypothetical protein
MIAMPVDKKSEKKPKNQIEIASPIKPATSTARARAMSKPINGYLTGNLSDLNSFRV